MLPTQNGSIRLFRLFNIQVFLHWSWFFVAYYTVSNRGDQYTSISWNIAEYLSLFLIVLMHEFGHSLACRSTGGQAEQIVLWPLGGVAYVNPPQRPGAQLWSIAAGPLVNVALAPFFYLALRVAVGRGLGVTQPDLVNWLDTVQTINLGLLIFNVLPIYPLDGGQMLRSVLWYFLGPATSLIVATVIGFLGGGALLAYAIYARSTWTAVLAGFLLFNCWKSFTYARRLRAHLNSAPPPFPTDS
jgi:Zn-dependent protease